MHEVRLHGPIISESIDVVQRRHRPLFRFSLNAMDGTVDGYGRVSSERENGLALVELLVAIVLVGILISVAIVAIDGLSNHGASAACSATSEAANSAQKLYYANHGAYPRSFNAMLTDSPQPQLALSGGATRTGGRRRDRINGNGWTLRSANGGGVPLTWNACP
jgi:prepilin-type N-terminal cleavage/methylation domain-containing protein